MGARARRSSPRRTGRGGTLSVVLAAVLLAGCAGTTPAPARPGPARLLASITQFRPDEGTRMLHAGVTNAGRTTLKITSATVVWPGFAWRPVRIADPTVPAGQTAAFTVEYGAARCDRAPHRPPRLVATVDGTERRLPLKVEDPALLERLYEHECAAEHLAATADLSLRLADRTVRRDGEEYLPGTVLLRRKPGSRTAVTVVDLGGSVLLTLIPARGEGALPAALGPTAAELHLPVLVGSAHRCDPHARGNSSQTFLLSVYTRLDGAADHRTIVVPDAASRTRLLALLDRDCG